MPKPSYRPLFALGLLALWPAQMGFAAPDLGEPGLPPTVDVVQALDASPQVEAAQAKTQAARADATALAQGPHEFTLTTSYLRRRVNDASGVGNGRFDEFEAQITRPVRLPGKAALDRQIGAQGVVYAENMAEDTRHQAALRLAQGWWDWLGAAQEQSVDHQAVMNYETLLASVKRRVALRDASALEEAQASAALDSARAQSERSRGREMVARARLAAQFPKLRLPAAAPDVPMPQLPKDGLDPLHDKILGRSHELAAATALSRQADAQAERADKERLGDPILGLRVFSEKGGVEKGAGVVFAMPFGGGARAAQFSRASAQASAAQADLQAVRLAMREVADVDMAEAQSFLRVWHSADDALKAQASALQKIRRGQQLGEISLADVLIAERMVHDALRAEAIARTDAMRALTRIRIDAHELWINDADD